MVFTLKDSNKVLEIKKGNIPFSEVKQMLENVVNEVERLAAVREHEGMRTDVDRDYWRKFVEAVHREVVKNS